MIEIVVNGEPREVTQGSTVATLLAELGLHPRGVAVEYNGEILKRAEYSATLLGQGDLLEIVRFVQGGRTGGLSFGDPVAIVPDGLGPLAQLAEQQTLNLRVRGSIPWRLTSGSSVRSEPFQSPQRSTASSSQSEGRRGVLFSTFRSRRSRAKVAELAYALDLGSSPVYGLGVRVPPFAPPEHSEAHWP